MSEKEKNEGTEKVVTRYDKKLKKRAEMKAKEAKEEKILKMITISIILVCVLGVAGLFYHRYEQSNGVYITVGGEEVSKTTFDYYYSVAVNNYQNMYGMYLSYMGLDVTGDLYAQPYSEDLSWGEFFEELAIDYLVESKVLTQAANDAGFVYDGTEEYKLFTDGIVSAAQENGVSISNYYKMAYGDYASASSVKPLIEQSILYSAYYEKVYDEIEITETQIQNFYSENQQTYDTINYYMYPIVAEYETIEGEVVEDTIVEAAMEIAKEKTEEFIQRIEEGELFFEVSQDYGATLDSEDSLSFTHQGISSINSAYSEWLYDESREDGDTIAAVDEINDRYYMVQFKERYIDNTLSANIRAILTTTMDGNTILSEWETLGNSEENFIELFYKYSEETSLEDGLIENITKDSVIADVQEWIFEDTRKIGDTTSIIAENGYTYVLYYVGSGKEQWKVNIENELISTTMFEYVEDLKSKIEVVDVKGNLKYLKLVDEVENPDEVLENLEE